MRKKHRLEQLESWLHEQSPEGLARIRTRSLSGATKERIYQEYLAIETFRFLLETYRVALCEHLYAAGKAQQPLGLMWEYALQVCCSQANMDRYVLRDRSLHRSIRRQAQIGARISSYTSKHGFQVLERVAECSYPPASPDPSQMIRKAAVELYLEEVEVSQIRGRPSVEQISLAVELGVVSLKAATLVKLTDYGKGLSLEEASLAQSWLEESRPGARICLKDLARAAGYSSGDTLRAALARWRRQIVTLSTQRGRPLREPPA